MKRLNNITDNRVLRKRKRKTYAEATQSNLLEGKIVGILPNRLDILQNRLMKKF